MPEFLTPTVQLHLVSYSCVCCGFFGPVLLQWPCWARLFNSKDLVFMRRAERSQHLKAQPESVTKQTGATFFFWFIKGILPSCCHSPPLNVSLPPPPPPPPLMCEGGTRIHLSCVWCCCHCDRMCMSANMMSVCICKDDVPNNNLSLISHFSPSPVDEAWCFPFVAFNGGLTSLLTDQYAFMNYLLLSLSLSLSLYIICL